MTQRALDRRAQVSDTPEGWDAAVCSWPDDAARAWTSRAVAGANEDAAMQAIVATGSAVRNVSRCDDLDLVLVYREHRPGLPRPPISIDLRHYECSDVPAKLAAGHDYLGWAVRYGRVLFERDCWWSQLRVDWNRRLPLPSVADARERAHNAERLSDELSDAGDAAAAAELHLSMLTHLARAALSDASVYPKSRPELADQLRSIGEVGLADRLAGALALRSA